MDYGRGDDALSNSRPDYFVLMASAPEFKLIKLPACSRVWRSLHSGSQSVLSGVRSIISYEEDL